MTITINNYARKVGQRGDYDWYRWKVFVDEGENKLNEIREVEYLLHPTFPNPKRVIKNSESAFALESAGWGSFNMLVTVRYKDGRVEMTRYFLDLNKPWPPSN